MEQLIITSTCKEEIYKEIIPQIESITSGETDMIANMANIAAVLKEAFDFFWVGFYIVKEAELVLGPFQGPLACTRIKYGRGVCGTAWKENRTLVVPDVDQFPGHIACSSLSRSEIVVPVYSTALEAGESGNSVNSGEGGESSQSGKDGECIPSGKGGECTPSGKDGKCIESGKCIAVLDIDSKELAAFDSVDAFYLQRIVALLQCS